MTVFSLTPKQKKFCDEYLIDFNGTQAAIRAGYSKKTVQQQSSRLLLNVVVQKYLKQKIKKAEETAEISREWIIARLCENVQKSSAAVELCDRQGNPTGKYKYDSTGANKALELLGKHLGMFTDKLLVVPPASDKQLSEYFGMKELK